MMRTIRKLLALLSIYALSFFISCSNILEFESITPCGIMEGRNIVRSWSNINGLVRYDEELNQFFIVARYPGESELSVLDVCNIPSEFLSDKSEIKFFGNEYSVGNDSLFVHSETRRKSVLARPFEITFIEHVVVY